MSSVNLQVQRDGAVATVTVDRPERLNALDTATVADRSRAFGDLGRDRDIRAVVLTGAGEKAFVAGADIAELAELDGPGAEHYAAGGQSLMWTIENLGKPVIAAVGGYALGGGLELAMGADFRYMAEDAKVGQPEILLGIIPGAGGTQRLQRLIGYQAAKHLNMSGRHVPADEALALGIADKVVPAGELVATAMADAAEWAKGPTKGYAAVKRAMGEGFGRPIDDAMDVERDAFNWVFGTEDAKTGILAFVNKEKPDFSGR